MGLIALDSLGPRGEQRMRRTKLIRDTGGEAVAELSVVPPLFITRAVMAQRKIRPLPGPERAAALTKAAEFFLTSSIAGLDFDAYVELTCRVAGLPLTVARAGAHVVAESVATAFDAIRPAQPTGAMLDWRDVPTAGGAVWARRGDVLAVHAPGNAPGVHGLWPQALGLGYRVAVRPSRREPFTAHRLIMAMRQAGFRNEDAIFVPTDYAGADELIRAADLSLVYGGQEVADRYAADPTVLVNGPGRSKIVITAECDWRDYLDVIVESIAGLGGMACVNTTAVLYDGDPGPLADAIADRLSSSVPRPHTDERATLPTTPTSTAQAIARRLAHAATATEPILGADQVVADLGDGYAALRPAVHLLRQLDVDTVVDIVNIELPFPCVWVSAWDRAAGLAALRHSQVVTAITTDESLLDDLLAEPSVASVYTGRRLTHWSAPHVPHDGFLADFLMRNRGFSRG